MTDFTASLAYAVSQESQACSCHLEGLEPILLVFTFSSSNNRVLNPVKSLLFSSGTTKEGGIYYFCLWRLKIDLPNTYDAWLLIRSAKPK